MKKFVVILSVALLAVTAFAAPASASWIITAGEFIGSGGPGTGESLAGNRFRSFANTGGKENYLGIPSLGNPAPQRVERDITWTTNTLMSYDFTFQYDQANDKLVSMIAGGTLEYLDWSTKLPNYKTRDAADLNAFQISVKAGDVGSNVYLTNMMLDGNALGTFSPSGTGTNNWLVTGSSMNLTDGFTLTGKLWLQGPFSNSQENSVVNLTAGWDARGVIPEPASALIFATGIVGFGLFRQRRNDC